MKREPVAWMAVAALAASALGCSMRTQVRNAAGDAGMLRSYAAPFEKVRQAALAALAAEPVPISEEWWIDRSRWGVLAAPTGAISVQRVARIVVEDHPTDCRVWTLVQSKPDLVEEAAAEELHARIATSLGLESRAGRPPAAVASEKDRRYRAPLARCAELAARACRGRGYEIVRQDDGDAALRTISAEKKPSLRLFAALYRQSDGVTRVVVEARGGAPEENHVEVSAIHEELLKELQAEP